MVCRIAILYVFLTPSALLAAIQEGQTMDRRTIPGVERLEWGKGTENTFIGALTVALRALGSDVTYDDVMGLSGAAFRLHIRQPQWCPSAPDANVGFNHESPARVAFGYGGEFCSADLKNPDEVAKARRFIVESIDAGRPVLGIQLVEHADWGVITGYEKGGEVLLCRDYYLKTDHYEPATKFPWIVESVWAPDEPWTARSIDASGAHRPNAEAIIRSLEIAVEIANTPKYGSYASGFAAYDAWIRDLRNAAMFAKAEDSGFLTHVNAWCYMSLIDARSSAVRYLRSIAGELDGAARDALRGAAADYERIVEALKAGRGNAPFPWQLADGKSWTQEMRDGEAATLAQALELEQKAVARIETALDLLRSAHGVQE